jgi:hypothetical protein
MPFCVACGGQMPAGAAACPACGRATGATPAAAPAGAGGLTDNVAGALAYVTIIPAIVFLVLEPYNRNRFIPSILSSALLLPWLGRRCGLC